MPQTNNLDGLEIRTATLIRTTTPSEKENRTFTALAVPYGEEYTDIGFGYFERFAQGSLQPNNLGAKLRLEHRETIGTVELDQREDGLYITGHISRTRAGEDAYTLLRDGALNAVSIGFRTNTETMGVVYDEEKTYITHNQCELIEVSVVTDPAYKNATVTNVRNHLKEKPMNIPNPTNPLEGQIDELRSSIEDLERRMTVTEAETDPTPVNPLASYRDAASYMSAVVGGSLERGTVDNLAEFVDTDTRPAWVDRAITLMGEAQPVTSLFTHGTSLPPTGLTFEYPTLSSNSVAVAQQETAGKELTYGEITFTHKSAGINTYGGYSAVTKDIIDRAAPAYLNTLFQAQAIAYAKAIEASTQALLTQVLTQQKTSSPLDAGTAVTALTGDKLIEILLDMVEHYRDRLTTPLDGILVSKDVLLKLATLPEDAKALQWAGQMISKIGTLTPTGLTGTISGLPLALVPGSQIMAGYSRAAIEIQESAGAPVSLTAENIITLTNTYSVYGYAAHYAPIPEAIVPVKFGA